MRKLIIALLLSVWLLESCGQTSTSSIPQEQVVIEVVSIDSIKGAYLSLNNKKHDFGKVRQKQTPNISIDFEVKNIGKSPLVIQKCDVSCGCLTVDYPKQPILSEGKGIITVHVDTKGQEGAFNKIIFIKSNADNDVELIRIVGIIQ